MSGSILFTSADMAAMLAYPSFGNPSALKVTILNVEAVPGITHAANRSVSSGDGGSGTRWHEPVAKNKASKSTPISLSIF